MPRVTISEPGKTPQPYRFKLERKIVQIGRGSDNDIVLECASASTHHCNMERVRGGYILRDKGSTNGIKLDDSLMEVIDLFDGMEVLVGDVPLKFQLTDDEIDTLAEESFKSHQRKKLPPSRDTDDELPRRQPASTSSPRASHRHQPTVQETGGILTTLFIFILMLVAVGAGFTLRHFKRTGDFLPAKLMQSSTRKKTDIPGKKAADNHGEVETPQKTETE